MAGKAAKGLLEARGIAQGSLADVDVMNPEFDAMLDDALGIHQNQHHPGWERNYPEAKKMPESILEAGVQHRDQDFRSIAGRFDRSAGPVNTISEGVYSQSAINISYICAHRSIRIETTGKHAPNEAPISTYANVLFILRFISAVPSAVNYLRTTAL